MERNRLDADMNYLTSSDLTEVLQVNTQFLHEVVDKGLVRPSHLSRQNGKNLWGPKDIFRAFLSFRLAEEYKLKYGNKNCKYKYEQIRRDLLSAERARRQEFIESAEWKAVVIRGNERGLNFLDL